MAAAILVSSLAVAGPAAAAGPVVVELFTSQGCSSCPPADEYLGELAGRSDVIPLAYHVDYWNYIGWNDPYASKQMTARQKDYARTLSQRYVYTPEMVVNGASHEVGSDRGGVEALIAAAKKAQSAGPPIAVALDATETVSVKIGGAPQAGKAVVWLVKFDREHTTPVARGENEGRTLTDYQVVRTMTEIGTWTGAPLELSVDLDKAGPGDGGCAILVQADGGAGPIIAAAMLKYAEKS
jgi:hypothetical protein